MKPDDPDWGSKSFHQKPEMCGSCGKNPAKPEHPCPYREELGGDHGDHCACCDECMGQCAMDI